VGEVAGGPDEIHVALKDALLAKTQNRGDRAGDAVSHLFHARGLMDFALLLMQAAAKP